MTDRLAAAPPIRLALSGHQNCLGRPLMWRMLELGAGRQSTARSSAWRITSPQAPGA
jgi:hypothetical protein